MPGEYEILRTLLSDRPIAFHPMLARVFGGINEALLFQQLAYWADKGTDPEWIYKTQKDIEDEITLTRTQQENARRRLRGLGVIEEDKRGVPAKLYFRVVWTTVYRLLEDHAAQDAGNLQPSLQAPSKDAGNLQPRMLEPRIQDRGEAPDMDGVRTRSITESTQRAQQRGPFEFSKGQSASQDYDEAREWLLPFVEDFAREMRDTAPMTSTLTRLVRIYRQSGLDEEQFTDRMYQARQVTKERVGSVKSGEGGKKRLMPYWFSVLERLIEDVA
jgi:hypothetical protein